MNNCILKQASMYSDRQLIYAIIYTYIELGWHDNNIYDEQFNSPASNPRRSTPQPFDRWLILCMHLVTISLRTPTLPLALDQRLGTKLPLIV